MLVIKRFSVGTGDRFGRQGAAQVAAFAKARAAGVEASIVWNKSKREHDLIGSVPSDQRAAASRAIAETGWTGPWHVDADHVGLATVEAFAPHCDFFTLDVADFIGKSLESGRRLVDQTLFKKCEDCEPRITRIRGDEISRD